MQTLIKNGPMTTQTVLKTSEQLLVILNQFMVQKITDDDIKSLFNLHLVFHDQQWGSYSHFGKLRSKVQAELWSDSFCLDLCC